jgi:hypothetical protein
LHSKLTFRLVIFRTFYTWLSILRFLTSYLGSTTHRLYVWSLGRLSTWGNNSSPTEFRVKTSLKPFRFVKQANFSTTLVLGQLLCLFDCFCYGTWWLNMTVTRKELDDLPIRKISFRPVLHSMALQMEWQVITLCQVSSTHTYECSCYTDEHMSGICRAWRLLSRWVNFPRNQACEIRSDKLLRPSWLLVYRRLRSVRLEMLFVQIRFASPGSLAKRKLMLVESSYCHISWMKPGLFRSHPKSPLDNILGMFTCCILLRHVHKNV